MICMRRKIPQYFPPLLVAEASVRALVLYVHVLDTYHYVVSRSTVIQHTTWDREIRETQRTTVLFAQWRRSQRVFSPVLSNLRLASRVQRTAPAPRAIYRNIFISALLGANWNSMGKNTNHHPFHYMLQPIQN